MDSFKSSSFFNHLLDLLDKIQSFGNNIENIPFKWGYSVSKYNFKIFENYKINREREPLKFKWVKKIHKAASIKIYRKYNPKKALYF